MIANSPPEETSMKMRVAILAVVLIIFGAINAFAISLTLQGMSGAAPGGAEALYASDSKGNPVEITEVGAPAPGGGIINEVGVPAMMADGRVLFGAEILKPEPAPSRETKTQARRAHWTIFIANPNAQAPARLTPALDTRSAVGCRPELSGDPYAVADANGDIAFVSAVAGSKADDALFLYSNGTLRCLAKSGAVTSEGDRLAVLSFGSLQMGEPGVVVFEGWLDAPHPGPGQRHLQALLMASAQGGVSELAVEGRYGPNHTRYKIPFGLPAALSSPQGTLVAFTARTPSGAALFLYDGASMRRVLPTGTDSPLGPVSYLSPGRPGLMADGTTAVLAACARIPVIFRLERGRMNLRLQRGQITPLGAIIESLGDPLLTASGAMYVGATDSDGNERLYVLNRDDAFFEIGAPGILYRAAFNPGGRHRVFTGTLSVNQRGDFTYLGTR
jgi:hypothetical protein